MYQTKPSVYVPTVLSAPSAKLLPKIVNGSKTHSGRTRTHIALIVDQSGSMLGIKRAIVEEFNRQFATFSEEIHSRHDIVSFITFGGSTITPLITAKRIHSLHENELSLNSYRPNGNTPLNDAVGFTLDAMQWEDCNFDGTTRHVVVVFTDGQENASALWSAQRLAERITALKKDRRNWEFVYVGTEDDLSVAKYGESLGFDYIPNYSYTETGLSNSMPVMSRSLVAYANTGDVSGLSECSTP